MKVEVKKVQSCGARNGVAWSCVIYVDGIKAGIATNSGNGGQTDFHWVDRDVEVSFLNHVDGLPLDMPDESWSEWELKEWPNGRKMDADAFISDLCDQFETNKRLKGMCARGTVVRIKGDNPNEVRIISRKFTPEFAVRVRKQHGDDLIEIVNEREEMK